MSRYLRSMNTLRFRLLGFFLLLATWGFAGDISRTYNLKPFRFLHAEGVIKVVLDQGKKVGMRLETTTDLENEFVYRQEGEHLYVGTNKETNWSGKKNPVLYVTVETLVELSFEGVGSLECSRQLIMPNLKVRVEGLGSVSLWLKVSTLNASMEGMGKLKLKGETQDAVLSLEGAGKIEAYALKALNMKVTLEGIGKAEVFCTNKLIASNEGIGSIRYRGKPRSLEKVNSGMGSIKPDEED